MYYNIIWETGWQISIYFKNNIGHSSELEYLMKIKQNSTQEYEWVTIPKSNPINHMTSFKKMNELGQHMLFQECT